MLIIFALLDLYSVQIKLENITTKIAEANSAERRRTEEDKKEDQEESEEEKEEPKDVSKEKLPAGLVSWRSAVSTATSPAQLALCLYQLNRSIAWEKSIMKVVWMPLNLLWRPTWTLSTGSFTS